MAVSKYIQSVKKETKGRPRSIAWYRQKIKEFGTPTAKDLVREGKQGFVPFYGRLNMFVYDPRLKKTLQYYDVFPLVLPIEPYSDGFLGINFHYLPIPLRIELLDRLGDFSNNTAFDESTQLIVDYQKLKTIRLIRPTIHRYLTAYTKSAFRRIDADEFTIATLLPVQKFMKATETKVWKDSREMI